MAVGSGNSEELIVVWHAIGHATAFDRVDLHEGYSTRDDIKRILSIATGFSVDDIIVDHIVPAEDVRAILSKKDES